ncbi:hypothetical protein KKF32_04995 [Patescibacteria group bacterium]|nr:hypothetical protein [Patescibacteria group bacterium]
MLFQISKSELSKSLPEVLRKCGYFMITSYHSGETSYVKRLSRLQHYPRFHLYVHEKSDTYQFNLHLDQKKPSYKGAVAHSAEYDEPKVLEEKERIINTLINIK